MFGCLNWRLIESYSADVAEGYEAFDDFLFAAIKDYILIVSLKKVNFLPRYDHELISIVKDKEPALKNDKFSNSADRPDKCKIYTNLRKSVRSRQKNIWITSLLRKRVFQLIQNIFGVLLFQLVY